MDRQTLTVGDVCDFIGGSQPPKSEFSDIKLPGYVRLVQTRDFKTDDFTTFIPKKSTSKFFTKNDIMIGRYGPPVFQIFRGMEGAYNVALMKAKPRNNITNDYLYYFLKQDTIFQYVDKLSARTGGQTGVDLLSLNKYPIYLPSLSAQEKIASVLSALDDKIGLNNKINAELEAMAKVLYDYWFVQFDFPNAEGKPYKSSGGEMFYDEVSKREIPKGWVVGDLSNLGDVIGGSTPPREKEEYFTKSGTAWITPRDLSNNKGKKFIVKGELDVSEMGIKNASLRVMPKGTVLLSTRAPVGYLAISQNKVTTNQGFKSFVPNKRFSTEFIYYAVKNLIPTIENNAVGSTFKEISASTLKSIPICLPETTVLDAYNKIITPFFDRQKILEQQNQELSSLRDWLLPMLMNGQVKVVEAYKKVEGELGMVAEEGVRYKKVIKLDIPENRRAFAKQVLAGKIVSLFKDDPNFTHIKFQKVQFLAEHIAQADFDSNYYFQSAGPYDNKLMHTILKHFERNKWFKEEKYKFVPLEKHLQIDGYYNSYFEPVIEKLNKLYAFLENSSEAFAEVIATLYAVWNNRIIKQEDINDDLIIEDFYAWSDRKQQYTKEELVNGLNAIREKNFEPYGFGKELKRAKGK
jgi:type I restriction enzyme S subunit